MEHKFYHVPYTIPTSSQDMTHNTSILTTSILYNKEKLTGKLLMKMTRYLDYFVLTMYHADWPSLERCTDCWRYGTLLTNASLRACLGRIIIHLDLFSFWDSCLGRLVSNLFSKPVAFRLNGPNWVTIFFNSTGCKHENLGAFELFSGIDAVSTWT